MSYSGMTKEFLGLLDSYKIDKIKKLVKEIGDTVDKHIEVVDGQYFFNKQEIIWQNEFLLELDKWEKFKKDRSFTEKKLKDRISKSIKEFLGTGENKIDVIKRLKSLKVSMEIESFSQSEITFKLIKKWIHKTKEIEVKYRPEIWLDWASINAKNISFSTHVAKLTHSSIKASNIYFDKYEKQGRFFSTSSIKNKTLDISKTDAKLSPISTFLQLESENVSIVDKLRKGDLSDIEEFATTKEQLKQWKNDFVDSFNNKKPSSHFLSKQVFFPVEDSYHLVSPLLSSSLIQTIYELKTSDDVREINSQKKSKKFHSKISRVYSNVAILQVTPKKSLKAHSNVSPLNVKRRGQQYLFPSTPPKWKSFLTPPLNSTSLFRGEYERKVWSQIKELQEYLLKIKDNKPNMYIKDNVRRNINWIIDILFNYVAEIQNLNELRGWSQEEGKLKESHRLWLDPYCEDELFQTKRAKNEWQDEVCRDFGLWLNKKLEHKEMLFVKINSDRWAKILKGRLKEFEWDLEVSR